MMIKIMVGVPTAGYSRNDSFYDFYNMLERPSGTPCMFVRGQSPARNRNIIIQQALSIDCSHILFIDDDVTFPPDLLFRLLAHGKDVVTGYYLMRNFPHKPIIFDESLDDGRCVHHFPEPGETELIEVVNTGLGCALIKTEVFKALEPPWIRLGQLEKDHWCDDIDFFNRVRAAGFKLYCDLTLTVGHMAQVVVLPVYQDGQWLVRYNTGGEGSAQFPALTLSPEKRAELLAGAK
jgi:glycosyltransferase involved in cell wall biosynthesis